MPPNKSSRRRNEEFEKDDPLTLERGAYERKGMLQRGSKRLVVNGPNPLVLKDHPDVFKGVPNLPEDLNVLDIKHVKLDALGRPGRRETIVALAGIEATVYLWTVQSTAENTTENKDQKRKRGAQRSKLTNQVDERCDLAIATIIALALNSTGDRPMVSELLALSPPSTMENFRPFNCKHDIIRFNDIPNLVHVVARNVAHDHNGGTDEPIAALKMTVEIVADILEEEGKLPKWNQGTKQGGSRDEKIVQTFETCIQKWEDNIDRGIQVGLVLAGVRKYFERVKEDKEKKYAIAFGLIDALLAGLTGVPVGGFTFGIAQSLFSTWSAKKKEKKLESIDELFGLVLDKYYEDVDFPLHRHKKLGGKAVTAEDVEIFSKWVNLVMRYNNLPQI